MSLKSYKDVVNEGVASFDSKIKISKADAEKLAKNFMGGAVKWKKDGDSLVLSDADGIVFRYDEDKGILYTDYPEKAVKKMIKESLDESLTTVPRTVEMYLKKVSSEEVFKKGQVRFDIQDGLFITFSAVGSDDNGKSEIIGYSIAIESRSVDVGMGQKLFYNWKTVYTEYYNLTTEKFNKSFDKAFR